jgi:hypothetical protein
MSPKVPKYWNSVKGDILNSLASMSFESYQWGEIEQIDMYGLSQMLPISDPEIVTNLNELVRDGDVIHDNDWYQIHPDLMKEYYEYIEYLQTVDWENVNLEELGIELPSIDNWDISMWTKAWLQIHQPEISLENAHFYLDGYLLDAFIKYLITKARKTIIVVMPFLHMITTTKLLIEATQNNKRVVLVTRTPNKSTTRKYLKQLSRSGVTILYHDNLHAKLLLFDDEIAIVSSMNLLVNATAGFSWEAGIVTLEKNTVRMIKDSITKLNLEPSKL